MLSTNSFTCCFNPKSCNLSTKKIVYLLSKCS
nr:MAG TPA: hypothetical protein [Caudoviricetes sp.]